MQQNETTWLKERRSGDVEAMPYRSEYAIDKSRIIHCAAMRRLQSKTQVLQDVESDFHRNRLTHSLEVAQIGSGIRNFLHYIYRDDALIGPALPPADLVEAIALAHDIGHPPFGHGGEVALNYMMREQGGFEANAQTLRLTSHLQGYSDHNGMNLTRRTMLGLLKYPAPYKQLCVKPGNKAMPHFYHQLNEQDWRPPKCYYDEDKDTVAWLLAPFSTSDKEGFCRIKNNANHNTTCYQSLDCSVMNIADDIAYATHDFEDGVELKIFDKNALEDVRNIFLQCALFKKHLQKDKQYSADKIDTLLSFQTIKWFTSVCVNFFILNTAVVCVNESFQAPLFRFNAQLHEEACHLLDTLKKVVEEHIINSPSAQQLVKNGQIITCYLFDTFATNYQLLPRNTQDKLKATANKSTALRLICDYVSGMTDRYAIKKYSKIFGSENISFFEK